MRAMQRDLVYDFDAISIALSDKYSSDFDIFAYSSRKLRDKFFRFGENEQGMKKFVLEENARIESIFNSLICVLENVKTNVKVEYFIDSAFYTNLLNR